MSDRLAALGSSLSKLKLDLDEVVQARYLRLFGKANDLRYFREKARNLIKVHQVELNQIDMPLDEEDDDAKEDEIDAMLNEQ